MTRTLTFYLVFIATLLCLGSCAQKPTRVFTTQDINSIFLEKELQRPIKIDAKTIFVDARSNFQFAMLHAPQSVHVSWTDFTKNSKSGTLKEDLTGEAQRLALLGIAPASDVVVLSGRDHKSWIDAGYVAWALMYLGVKQVQLVNMHHLHIHYYNNHPPPRPNAPVWQPKLAARMLVNHSEIEKLKANIHTPFVRVIDSRTHAEFSFEWREFFNRNDRPSLKMKRKLNAMGIKDGDRIIALSSRGLRAAAVAYSLLAVGFRNVGILPGGTIELLNRVSSAKFHMR